MAIGFIIMTLTVFLTLATFCRQSICGKSIHTVIGSAQAVAGKFDSPISYLLSVHFRSIEMLSIAMENSLLFSFHIAICVLISLFLHPFGWGHTRVKRLCGADSEPFWPSDCSLGMLFCIHFSTEFNFIVWKFCCFKFNLNTGNALACAIIGVLLGFGCAAMSIKAESGNMNTSVKRRIEAGERLLCVM